jgi:hypothetical protein
MNGLTQVAMSIDFHTAKLFSLKCHKAKNRTVANTNMSRHGDLYSKPAQTFYLSFSRQLNWISFVPPCRRFSFSVSW